MRIFPHRGMPARGSFQERILQEMLLREQRKEIVVATYHGHLLAAGLGIRPELFSLWTDTLCDEISHNNYTAETIARKKRALALFAERHTIPRSGLKRAEKYTVKDTVGYLPYSEEELAQIKDKVRARTLDNSLRHGVERQKIEPPVTDVPRKK